MLDFNQADRQQSHLPGPPTNDRERVERLKAELGFRLESVLHYLLPGGRVVRNEYEAADTTGTSGRSLKVRLDGDKRGVWSDFATGEIGSDPIDLWQAVKRCDFPTALKEIEGWLGLAPPIPARVKSADKKPNKETILPPPSATWHYLNADGNIMAMVRRYDLEDGSKEFRPWDALNQKFAAPDPRPLYNLPGIKTSNQVVLVEGEKCADALIGLGICATTAMGGSNAPTGKTDWTPLTGKSVLIWPDNDETGKKYAGKARASIEAVGGKARVLEVPADKPEKWDAADAVLDGFDIAAFLSEGKPEVGRINLKKWSVALFEPGKAPDREWLVDGVFPLAVAGLLCATGDTGKGMLGLDLALKAAGGYGDGDLVNPITAFGNKVAARGTAVIFSAEDDQAELWRRLDNLDPSGERRKRAADKMVLVPLPNAGGPVPLVVPGRNGPEVTEDFRRIVDQLTAIKDLRLVLLDPMAAFVLSDVTTDPAAGAFATGLLASIATETGAAVIVAHHMNKSIKEISSPENARAAIRGTTAIVDGVRCAYALWTPDAKAAKAECKRLGVQWARGMVCHGAVVKSNGPADRRKHVWLRNGFGLLEVKNDVLARVRLSDDELKDLLVADIAQAGKDGRPFRKTGVNGLYERRDELTPELRDLSKHKIDRLTRELLEKKLIVRAAFQTSKFLDVPEGQFAQGIGQLEPGYRETERALNTSRSGLTSREVTGK